MDCLLVTRFARYSKLKLFYRVPPPAKPVVSRINEAEVAVAEAIAEPDIEQVVIRTKKRKGQHKENLNRLPVRIANHELTKEQLLVVLGLVSSGGLHFLLLINLVRIAFSRVISLVDKSASRVLELTKATI